MKHAEMTNLTSLQQQRGGTLLGIIIGALIGLGVALAVAVYVTKVPVPFMNKGQSHSPENDAIEAQKNKDWNPNASLTGKTPGRPAAVSGGVVGAVNDTSTPTVSADPLGDLAKAKSEAKSEAKSKIDTKSDTVATGAPVATGTEVEPFNYFVQAGAFRTPEDAEQQRAKLLLMGFQAKVTEREQSGRTIYRVRLGPFDKKDEADRTKEKLDSNSIETALVRVQR